MKTNRSHTKWTTPQGTGGLKTLRRIGLAGALLATLPFWGSVAGAEPGTNDNTNTNKVTTKLKKWKLKENAWWNTEKTIGATNGTTMSAEFNLGVFSLELEGEATIEASGELIIENNNSYTIPIIQTYTQNPEGGRVGLTAFPERIP